MRKSKTKLIFTHIVKIRETELNSCGEWIPAEWVKLRFFLTPELEIYQLETTHSTHTMGTCEITGVHTNTQPLWISHNKEAVVKVFVATSLYFILDRDDKLECKLKEWAHIPKIDLCVSKSKVVYQAIHVRTIKEKIKAPSELIRKIKKIKNKKNGRY